MNFTGSAAAQKVGASLSDLDFQLNLTRQSITTQDNGAKIQFEWNVTSGMNYIYKRNNNTELDGTYNDSFVMIDKIVRTRQDTSGNDGYDFVTILDSEIETTTSQHTLDDYYALWFNATYTYKITGKNVITGDIDIVETTITTDPAIPLNMIQQSNLTNPYIDLSWTDKLNMGSATILTYQVKRNSYDVSGQNASNNTIVVTVPDVVYNSNGKTHSIMNHLPGKDYTVQVRTNANSLYSDYDEETTVTVPNLGVYEPSVVFTVTAAQNPVQDPKTLSQDSFGNALGNEADWVTLEITDFTYNDSTNPMDYHIYEKEMLLETISRGDVINNGNKVYVSKTWKNNAKSDIQDDDELFFHIVAVDSVNNKYSLSGITQYAKALGIASAPIPEPTINLSITSGQNKTSLSWSNADVWVTGYKVYQLRVNGQEHYESKTETSFTQPILEDVNTVLTEIADVQTTTYEHNTPTPLYDNAIYAYRVIAYNRDGVFSKDNGGDLQYASTIGDVNNYNKIFAATYVQAKTAVPLLAGEPTITLTSGGINNISISWSHVPGSTDEDIYYSLDREIQGDVVRLVNSPNDSSPGADTSQSYNYTDLMPNTSFTFTVLSYTNMHQIHSDVDDWQQCSNSVPKVLTTNSVISDKVTKLEPVVRTSSALSSNLEWSLPTYEPTGSNSVPSYYVPEWRNNSVNANAPTIYYLDNANSSTINDGDCIAIFDGSTKVCLDIYIWNGADVTKKLTCSQDIVGGDGMTTASPYLQVWRQSTKQIEPLYISSYTKLDGNGNLLYSNIDDVTRIDGGATAGSYTSVGLTVADKKYKIYKYGRYTNTTVTNVTSATIDQGDEQYYDVTYYVDEQSGIDSYSGKYGGASNESNPSVSGGGSSLQMGSYSQMNTLLSQPTYVTYSVNPTNTDIQLGEANSQTFTFTHGQWNLISFYSLDTSKTTIQTLFGSIPVGYKKIIIFDQAYNQFSYESGVWSPSTDEDINYDSGYYVKVLFDGGSGTVTSTVTGSEFTYLKTDLTTGFNFISWPFATSSDASALLDMVKNEGAVTDTFWSYLRILFTPSGAAITGPQSNSSAQYTTGDITLQPGSAYIVNVSSAFDIDNGTISTITPAQIKEQNIKRAKHNYLVHLVR